MAALLVRDAGRFDVIVTTNMFGDILSDQASEICGQPRPRRLAQRRRRACAWRRRSTARRPTSPGRTSPIPASLIGSAAMLLDWLGERRDEPAFRRAGHLIREALEAAISEPTTRTRDLGGGLGTAAFTDAVIATLHRRSA